MTCGPKSRSARARLRSWHTRSGRSSTIATGSTWYCARELDERLPRLGLDVGGVDDGQPPAREPLRRDEVQHLEGVLRRRLVVLVVGDERRGRSPTTSISVGAKCVAREGATCRDPDGPIRTTRESSGIVRVAAASCNCRSLDRPREDRHLRRRADLRIHRPDRHEAHRVAEPLGDVRRPTRWNSARVHSKRWSRWRKLPRRQRSANGRCTRRSASSATTVAGPRELEHALARRPPAAADRDAR